MIQVIGHTMPYDKYDQFFLCHRFECITMRWMLIGVFNKKYVHYIVNSDNEDEIRVWADVHKINIENKIIENYNVWSMYSWYLNGTYNNIPIWFNIASNTNREELLVWADMNNIKIEDES